MILAVVAAAVVAPAAPAAGTDPNGDATFIGAILPQGRTASLLVRYRCAAGTALWISVAQARTGAADARLKRRATRGAVAATVLQTHGQAFTCDGRARRSTFEVAAAGRGSRATMRPGVAWVELRVTDGRALVLSKAGWVNVNLRAGRMPASS